MMRFPIAYFQIDLYTNILYLASQGCPPESTPSKTPLADQGATRLRSVNTMLDEVPAFLRCNKI
jgi:hypothetical protein